MKYLSAAIAIWSRMCIVIGTCICLSYSFGNAQCSLACNGSTQVSLDLNCEAEVTADMILNDQMNSCGAETFSVTISNQYGVIPTSPILTGDYMGQDLSVKVTANTSGNSCWGNIILEDKLGPEIDECPTSPIDLRCNDFTLDNGPTFMDACEGAAEAILLSETIDPLECDDDYIKTITRVYTSYDSHGKQSPNCTIIYNLLRINFDDISCPPSYIRDDNNGLSCDGTWKPSQLCSSSFLTTKVEDTDTNGDGILDADMRWDDNNNGYPEPEEVGVPTITTNVNGVDVQVDLYPFPDVYCNSAMLYTDIELPEVGCSKKIMRTWTLREWHCTGERTFACDPPQILEIVDDKGPELICPEPVQVSTNTIMGSTSTVYGNVTCGASIYLELPQAVDDCSDNLTYDVTYDGGFEKHYTGNTTVTLPMGVNSVTFAVYDECYNSTECEVQIEIVDNTPPVAVCDQYTAVGLTTGGEAVVNASTFDDGSYDDCKQHCMLVRRMDPGSCDCKVPEFCGLNYIGENNGSYYYLSTYSASANIAKKRAEAYGGSLAIFETQLEEEWLVSRVRQNYSDRFWIGMKRFASGFLWDDHEPLSYQNWRPGKPLQSDTRADLTGTNVGNTVLFYDGATVSDGADMVSNLTLTAGPTESIIDISWNWIPRSEGTFTINDGVNLKLLHYDGYKWRTIYTERYTGLNSTNTIESLLDVTQSGSFRYVLPADAQCGTNYIRIAIEDNAFSSDIIVGDFATGDCDSHFDNADAQFEMFTGECVGECVMMTPYNDWNDASCLVEIPYILEIKDICGFSETAKFCCADVGTEQMVVFRVVDIFGNYNDCMVNVNVQDKLAPTLICPPDQTVDCDIAIDPSNLNQFGEPTINDDCGATVDEEGINELSNCNLGTYTRVFTATDDGGRTSSCKQIITFENDDPITGGMDVVCPRDTVFIGCMVPEDLSPEVTGYPEYMSARCGLLGTNYTDEVFTFTGLNGDACFKILRRWEVIDWCQSSLPFWTCTQVIKVTNGVKPVITGCDTVEVCTYDSDCMSGFVELKTSATDDCTDDSNLRWQYAVYAGELGEGPKSFTNPVATGSGDGNMADASGNYPVGSHIIRWTYFDRCGNASSCDQPFTIANCKAPTAYCIAGLAVDLMPMDFNGDGVADFGMVELWASDFNAGSSHPCGYEVFLSFSPDTSDRNITFDCTTRGDQEVQIWASVVGFDGELIQTYCTSIINVQDNNNACQGQRPETVDVGGQIFTEDLISVNDVQVELGGSTLVENTNGQGIYSFPEMPMGGNYIINPSSNQNPLNGVTTMDLVHIQRHILGIEQLQSPYKIIAADVNNDGQLTTIDLLELRKLILGVYDELPNNDSWRFVDYNYAFLNSEYPLEENFTEDYLINKLESNMDVDFVAIKVGDVNNSIEMLGSKSKDKNAKELVMSIKDQKFSREEFVQVRMDLSNQNISGTQFGFTFDDNQLVLEDIVGLNKSNYRVIGNQILISINDVNGDVINDLVIDLEFSSLIEGKLSSAIGLNSSRIKAEAYIGNTILKPVLNIETLKEDQVFELYKNTPNPFADQTTVSFNLPKEEMVLITINDLQGRVIKTVQQTFNKGLNSIDFNVDDLGQAGIYYLTLKTENNIATLKMVALK